MTDTANAAETPGQLAEGTVTTADGATVNIQRNPSLAVVTTPEGVESYHSGDDFEKIWVEVKHLFGVVIEDAKKAEAEVENVVAVVENGAEEVKVETVGFLGKMFGKKAPADAVNTSEAEPVATSTTEPTEPVAPTGIEPPAPPAE